MRGKRYFCSQLLSVKLFYLLLIFVVWSVCARAQEVTDSARRTSRIKDTAVAAARPPVISLPRRIVTDSNVRRRDSVAPALQPLRDSMKVVKVAGKSGRQTFIALLRTHPYFNFFGRPVYEMASSRPESGKEPLFYLLVAIVLYFAFIQLIFRKYLNNLFAFFFQVSMRQKQMREHLMHSPVPALLLNIFFIVAGGVFISFVLSYYHFQPGATLWRLMLYSVLALGSVYIVKLITLKIVGWVFTIGEAVNTYIFVVYSVNKLIGIFLIPFVVLLAFSERNVAQLLITLSFIMIVLLFLYRYIVAYVPVRKEIRVSQFHFLLYICAFEVMPLLLIYKVLVDFLERSY